MHPLATNETTPGAWYALRRALVPFDFEPWLHDLLAACKQAALDEVIVMCDAEEFNHGIPDPAWLETEIHPLLLRTREALRAIGVVYSLNPWVTQGHTDRGRDLTTRYPALRMMVGHDGTRTKAQACPLCPHWRAHTARLWEIYASTEPHVLWVEDDIRTFNHMPVRLGCFCAEHLRRFAERVGRPAVSREELVAALLAPGQPHPWRTEWLALQGDVMIDTVGFLRQTVQAHSPHTRLGLMSSGPPAHAMEGRRWREFGAALAGEHPLYSRPPLGNYTESSLRGLYYSDHSIKNTRHCLAGATVIEQTEVENFPHTHYSKSDRFTALQILHGFTLGCAGVTLNIFDLMGRPLAEEPATLRMLGAIKPLAHAITSRSRQATAGGGIQLLHEDHAARALHLPPGADFDALMLDAHAWADPLLALGFPTTYDEANVVALSGQLVRALPPERLRALLARGVLLDGAAAHALCQLGYGDLIGLHVTKVVDKDAWATLAAEEWDNPAFGGAPRRYLTMTLPDLGGGARLALFQPAPGAQVVSHAVDPDGRAVAPHMLAFENSLGGRVVATPLVLHPWRYASWLSPLRKQMLSHLLGWLGRGQLELEVTAHEGVYPLPILRRAPGRLLVGAFNLSLDPWLGVSFSVADGMLEGLATPRFEVLTPATAQWTAAPQLACRHEQGRLFLDWNEPVACGDFVLLDLHG